MEPATREHIVHHFLNLLRTRPRQVSSMNWGCTSGEEPYRSMWDIGGNTTLNGERIFSTYINGVIMTIDGDFDMGYLLELVEHDTKVVSFVVITTHHGFRKANDPDLWSIDHDSEWYGPDCGTFFERTDAADHSIVGRWAVATIYNLWDSYRENARRKFHEGHVIVAESMEEMFPNK